MVKGSLRRYSVTLSSAEVKSLWHWAVIDIQMFWIFGMWVAFLPPQRKLIQVDFPLSNGIFPFCFGWFYLWNLIIIFSICQHWKHVLQGWQVQTGIMRSSKMLKHDMCQASHGVHILLYSTTDWKRLQVLFVETTPCSTEPWLPTESNKHNVDQHRPLLS